ncbi:hypothetical protein Y032_0045g1175 [Ancylostoma ceylanicum]|uniref:Uncharacterized protein n=1 Tax=Ancylostoma ceylanicum TaxID=53326 RepID=A0A016UCA1_9BILA|nr:hypothetical protein Y032_0045g1175 [Ancylostoma ceylanicum]
MIALYFLVISRLSTICVHSENKLMMLQHSSQPTTIKRCLFSDVCPNSSFEQEYIDDYIVGKINDERYGLLAGLTLNGPWQGKDKWTPETQGYGKKLPKGRRMYQLVR